jgi:hypothetical protein
VTDTERVEAFDAIAQRRHIERDGVLYTADLLTRNGGSLSNVSVWSRDKVWLADPDDDGMVEVLIRSEREES